MTQQLWQPREVDNHGILATHVVQHRHALQGNWVIQTHVNAVRPTIWRQRQRYAQIGGVTQPLASFPQFVLSAGGQQLLKDEMIGLRYGLALTIAHMHKYL
jgi:hypothetical protein